MLLWEWNRLTDVEGVEIFLRWENKVLFVGASCTGTGEGEIGGLACLVLHWCRCCVGYDGIEAEKEG